MKITFSILATLVLPTTLACTSSSSNSNTQQKKATAQSSSQTLEGDAVKPVKVTPDSIAYFAGGCFWGVEHFLEQIKGVDDVDSGYMGGTSSSPSYKEVSSGSSGHLEAVRVRYDSTLVSYRDITKRFFEIHDPTQADGQGPDLGAQYLSAVFYATPSEKTETQELINILTERDYTVATKLLPVSAFWPAEDYHQDYYARSGKEPYCHAPVHRFGP